MSYEDDQELKQFMIDEGLMDAPRVIKEQVHVEVGAKPSDNGQQEDSRPDIEGDENVAAVSFNVAMSPQEPDWYVQPDYLSYFFDIWPTLPDQPLVKLVGKPGTGKTLACDVLAARLGRPLLRQECEPDMTAEQFLGVSRIRGGADYLQPGIFAVAAMMQKAGRDPIVQLDEFSVLAPQVQYKLAPLVGSIVNFTCHAIGRRFEWHGPKVVCTYNEEEHGNREITGPIKDRGRTLEVKYLPRDDEVRLLITRKGLSAELAEKAVGAAAALREAADPKDAQCLPIDFDCTWRCLEDFADGVNYGQSVERSWTEAVFGRVGTSRRLKETREQIRQISISAGMMS